jgi:AbrB family looped-hinge helix DNA binding protein
MARTAITTAAPPGSKPSKSETGKIGRRGTFVIPSRLRKRYGMNEGTVVVAEEREDGILIRPAVVMPIEIYTDERIAEFLLNNAVGEEDYARVVKEVRRMGLDPDKIDHIKPGER